LIGCLGSLAALLAWRGKARRLVVALLMVLTGLGVLCGIAALVALAGGQPYAVWFPLALGAVIILCICPYRLRQYQKKYEELELRRMASLEA
jgi:CHASE2 domain-containing sensor protein